MSKHYAGCIWVGKEPSLPGTRYVIHKSTRVPGNESYYGPTWDNAGLRHLWEPTYANKEQAQFLARQLTKANPVGFTVAEVELDNE